MPIIGTSPPALVKMGDASTSAKFTYWASNRTPDPSEAYSIANGECEGMKSQTSAVYDMRSSQSSFDLDQHGFRIVKHRSRFVSLDADPTPDPSLDFSDDAAVTAHYWPETCTLIQSILHARSVITLHSIVRTSSSDHRHQEAPNGRPKANKPFFVVHVDYAPAGCRTMLRSMLPSYFEDVGCIKSTTSDARETWWMARSEILAAETEDIKSSPSTKSHLDWDGANYSGPRWAVYSIWRPLEIVQSDPLAVLDPRSVFAEDPLHGSEKKYQFIRIPHKNRPVFIPEYEITNMMPLLPRRADEHKWCYVSNQRPDEVYVIKLFDSEAWKEGQEGKGHALCSALSF